MKQWRNIIDPPTNNCIGWALYLGEKQAAMIYPSINDPNFNYKFSASFDCRSYGNHGLNAKTLEEAKEKVEEILFEGYLNVIDKHTKTINEYNTLLQHLGLVTR